MSSSNNSKENDDSDDNQPQIPYRRDRTPSIVVQSLGLSFHKDSNITESIELPGDEDEDDFSQHSNSSGTTDPRSSASCGNDESPNIGAHSSSADISAKGSMTPSPLSTPLGANSPVRAMKPQHASKTSPNLHGNDRRLSLNIGSTAPRRQSLTVDGLSSFVVNPAFKDVGNATGSLRNKAALKPGHSLMGWIRLASTAKDLSGTNGKILDVTSDELMKHDKESDCWIALKGNVYNVTTYLQYHPGGVEQLMRAAGRDATELFNEVHRWVNYESILAKCLVGPYKLDSPLTPQGAATFATTTPTDTSNKTHTSTATNKSSVSARVRDPTVAQKPNRRQSIALTVPSPNKYQSLLLSNSSSTNLNQVQQPPTYVIMQDKSCIKLKVQDLNTLPLLRSRNVICDLNEHMELHLSVILSSDWLYRVHLRLDQQVDEQYSASVSNDDRTITVQLIKKEPAIWNKIGTSLDLNDSLCEMTLADKFFRPCQLKNKSQLTHDTYLFTFKLERTVMFVPIGCHVLMREYLPPVRGKQQQPGNQYDDYRVQKNYTPVMECLVDNDGFTDKTNQYMSELAFIIKIYPDGMLTQKLNQLNIGDRIEISDYQCIDFDIERQVLSSKHWFLFAAGTGITPFCRIVSYLLNQNEDMVESVHLVFFNKTQKDIIWREEFSKLLSKHQSRFQVTHVLSNESDQTSWTGKRGRVNKEIVADLLDSHSPDELQLLACGPRPFTQMTKTITSELNLNEKLYIFHG